MLLLIIYADTILKLIYEPAPSARVMSHMTPGLTAHNSSQMRDGLSMFFLESVGNRYQKAVTSESRRVNDNDCAGETTEA